MNTKVIYFIYLTVILICAKIPLDLKMIIDFLKISEKKLLLNTGEISHKKALEKAKTEFNKYRKAEDKKYISDFDREMKRLMESKNDK